MTGCEIASRIEALPCMKGEGAQTASQKRIERRLIEAITAWLDTIRAGVEAWAREKLERETKKAVTAGPPLGDAHGLFSSFVPIITDAYTAGATEATNAIGVNLDLPSEEALEFARERAAELVGKKWIDGELVDNPAREWCITDTLRDDIHSLVNTAIEEGQSWGELASALRETGFGHWRAETIARTETTLAYGNGAVAVYDSAGVEYVKILDGPGCLPEGHEDGAGAPTGEPGEVEEDAEANEQIWTLSQYASRLIAHPNCVRAAVPFVVPGSYEIEGEAE